MKTVIAIIIGAIFLFFVFNPPSQDNNQVQYKEPPREFTGLNKHFSEIKKLGGVIDWKVSEDQHTMRVTVPDKFWDNISTKQKAQLTHQFLDAFFYYVMPGGCSNRCVDVYSERGLKVANDCCQYEGVPKVYY